MTTKNAIYCLFDSTGGDFWKAYDFASHAIKEAHRLTEITGHRYEVSRRIDKLDSGNSDSEYHLIYATGNGPKIFMG